VDADQIVYKATLDLTRQVIGTGLLILSGQGIDVILGMSWMKWHKAILDIAARLGHLNSHAWQGHPIPSCDLLHQGVLTSRG
jgi:hypothetical protein